jgi:O-antigen/teichoic acid export membrane protein
VGWLALSLMAVGSLVIVTTGLNIIKETGAIGRTTIVTAIINIGLSLVFIPQIGLQGAAVAAALDQGIAAILLYRLAQKRQYIPFDSKRVGIWLAFIVSLVSIASYLPTNTSLRWFIIKLGIVAAYIAMMACFGDLSRLRTMYRLSGVKSAQPSVGVE